MIVTFQDRYLMHLFYEILLCRWHVLSWADMLDMLPSCAGIVIFLRLLGVA